MLISDVNRLQDFLEFLEMPRTHKERNRRRMDLRVIGCHGGETPKHRTSAFVLDDDLAIDAGSLTSGMELKAQCALEACLVSHAHLDHIRDLATIADNRCQNGCAPLVIAGTKAHDSAFSRSTSSTDSSGRTSRSSPSKAKPTIEYLELQPEKPPMVAGYEGAGGRWSITPSRLRLHRARARRAPSRTAATPGRPSASGRCSNELTRPQGACSWK